jgi:hypothetical protein
MVMAVAMMAMISPIEKRRNAASATVLAPAPCLMPTKEQFKKGLEGKNCDLLE